MKILTYTEKDLARIWADDARLFEFVQAEVAEGRTKVALARMFKRSRTVIYKRLLRYRRRNGLG